jgi:uncharacterized coiled-coil DUF342 family protein
MDQSIELSIKLLKEAIDTVKETRTLREELQQRAEANTALKDLLRSYTDRFVKLDASQSEHLKKVLEILQEHGQEKPQPIGALRPDDLARQFRTLIEKIQSEAQTPREGETAAIIKSLDVELKGLIVVDKDEAKIVPPHPDKPIEAGQLSILRMSFGSIPVLRATVNKNDKEPS